VAVRYRIVSEHSDYGDYNPIETFLTQVTVVTDRYFPASFPNFELRATYAQFYSNHSENW
jgi:hypothetical protein